MREIKFRCYDKEMGRYVTATHHIGISCEGFVVNLQDGDGGHERYELQQFTGLLDKNGKEDYHSNILRDVLTGKICTVEYGQYRSQAGTGFGWFLKGTDGREYTPYPHDLDGWEIIGNIFENANLLAKSEKEF